MIWILEKGQPIVCCSMALALLWVIGIMTDSLICFFVESIRPITFIEISVNGGLRKYRFLPHFKTQGLLAVVLSSPI
jgi:hypothetical protein